MSTNCCSVKPSVTAMAMVSMRLPALSQPTIFPLTTRSVPYSAITFTQMGATPGM